MITIGHKTYDTPLTGTLSSEQATKLAYDGIFTVVTGVSRDSGGHVSGYTTTKMQMPTDTNETFTLSGDNVSAADNVATIVTNLTGSINSSSSATLKIATTEADNLQVTGSGNQVTISMVWGTF